MIVYTRFSLLYIFAASLLLAFLLLIKKKTKYKKGLLIFFVILFSVLFGFRDFDIGVDTAEYLSRYVLMSGNKDPLFALLTNFLNFILLGNKHLYLFTIALINNSVFAYAIFRLSSKNYNKAIFTYLLTIMLPYVILSNINIIRQGLSMSFIMLALSYFRKKNSLFIASVLVSIGFHKMMVFFWLIYFIIYYLNKHVDCMKYKYLFILSAMVCILLKLPFIVEILKFFGDNFYINKLLLHISPVSISNILKILFYYTNYLIICYFCKKEDKSIGLMKHTYITLLFSSAIFSFSELYSMRFLIAIEYILPYMYLMVLPKQFKFTNKKLNIYPVFIIICYSYLFISLYLNALSTDLRL